jgi:hypothetical protein
MTRTKSRGACLKLIPEAAPSPASSPPPSAPGAGPAIARSASAPTRVEVGGPSAPDALVDGKRVVIEAADEIVLRCGKASITLRRNGRVVIRGVYVETRAEGVNRVKGGSVQIN